MRGRYFAAGLCLLFGPATDLWAQQSLSLEGTRQMLGSATGQQVKFKPLDTSNAVAPIPAFGQPRKGLTLKSLIPSWLRPSNTPAQPTSMRALKRSASPGANTSTPAAFKPEQPSTPSP